mgnify:FL=1|jgi:hypothetical protein
MIQKYRSLPKVAKTVQSNLTAFPNSVQILNVAGFVDQGETLEIMNYNQQQLQDVMDAIVYFVGTLGATVKSENAFNPYAESCISSTL